MIWSARTTRPAGIFLSALPPRDGWGSVVLWAALEWVVSESGIMLLSPQLDGHHRGILRVARLTQLETYTAVRTRRSD